MALTTYDQSRVKSTYGVTKAAGPSLNHVSGFSIGGVAVTATATELNDAAANSTTIRFGAYTANGTDASNAYVTIPTGLTAPDTIINAEVIRSTERVGAAARLEFSGGNLIVRNSTDGTTFVLASGDVFHWCVGES